VAVLETELSEEVTLLFHFHGVLDAHPHHSGTEGFRENSRLRLPWIPGAGI
jgi:hypothetical protein